jgi:hypothetical protein
MFPPTTRWQATPIKAASLQLGHFDSVTPKPPNYLPRCYFRGLGTSKAHVSGNTLGCEAVDLAVDRVAKLSCQQIALPCAETWRCPVKTVRSRVPLESRAIRTLPTSSRREGGYMTCTASEIRTQVLGFKTPNFRFQLGIQVQQSCSTPIPPGCRFKELRGLRQMSKTSYLL